MNWELLPREEVQPFSGAASIPVRGDRPWGHTYRAKLISQAVNLVMKANSSLRGAAQSFQIFYPETPESNPSLWSIRNWVLRVGLHELQQPKLPAGDWALILDHTIQVGTHKALLVLGVRLGQLDRDHFALGHQDVKVLALEICAQSNGQKVLATLEKIQEQIGEPRLMVSDAGSDIKKAIGLFCERHPHTDWVPDVSHRMARLLEAELKENPVWECFLSQAAQCRSQCQQTPLSPLMPPAQRGKARWMNYQPLVTWALHLIQNPVPSWADLRLFKRLFGWVSDFEQEVGDCWMMMHLGQETGGILKRSGIDSESLSQCRELLKERAHGTRLRRYADGIREYLREVETKLRPGERLLGSSDIIESIFGKYKLLVERSPEKTITRLILAIGALTSQRTPESVSAALEAVNTKAVAEWFAQFINESPRSLRQKAFA